MITCYDYDTPIMLKSKDKMEELKILMNKIYVDPQVAEERSNEIEVTGESD